MWLVCGTSAFLGCDCSDWAPTAPVHSQFLMLSTFEYQDASLWGKQLPNGMVLPILHDLVMSFCAMCPSASPMPLWEDRDQDVPHSCHQGSTEEMTQSLPLLSSCIPEVCSSALSQFSVLEKLWVSHPLSNPRALKEQWWHLPCVSKWFLVEWWWGQWQWCCKRSLDGPRCLVLFT